MRRSYLEELQVFAVNHQGVFLPGNKVQSALSRYVRPLTVWNDHEVYRVSVIGSATHLKYRGRYLMVCSQHQLAGQDLQRVQLLYDDGSLAVTSQGVQHFNLSGDTDAYDIACFDFTEPCEEHPLLKERFYNLTDEPLTDSADNIVASVVSGYPSTKLNYDLEASNRLDTVRSMVTCKVAETAPLDDALQGLEIVNGISFDPDGMSGGSAFHLVMQKGEFQTEFGGIVLHGGRASFEILRGRHVRDFLRFCLSA